MSIVTACYNAEATIRDTLASVRNQSYPNTEHVVIDGGSGDGTRQILEANSWPGLRVTSERDKGIYDAMNKGIQAASGDIVAFLNADDFLASPNTISAAVKAFSGEPRTDCVFGHVVLVDPVDHRRIRRSYKSPRYPSLWFRFGHMPPHPGAFIRRDVLVDAGGFDLSYKIVADFDLLLRLVCLQKVRHRRLNETVTVMRLGGVSTTGLSATVRINKEMASSCKKNGVASQPILIWMKYLAKWSQLIVRPEGGWEPSNAWPQDPAN